LRLLLVRYRVNSTLEVMGNSNIAYLKKGIRIDKFGIEVCYKKIHKLIYFLLF